MKTAPVVAITGRPNTGKSAIFNAIVRRRHAIVHSESGVTRDRIVCNIHGDDYNFQLIDTGGLGSFMDEKRKAGSTEAEITKQVMAAIETADLILFVADITEGLTVLDSSISEMLRRKGKKVFLVLNKSDNEKMDTMTDAFAKLAWENVFPVSALHRRGIDDLLDSILDNIDAEGVPVPEEIVRISVAGRPNVGKSSLINKLLKKERVIVSEIPGTTRDAVDVEVELDLKGEKLRAIFTDTAGLRQKRRADSAVEIFSIMRTERAIKNSSVVIFILDATSPGTAQDRRIGRIIDESGRACIILANKRDLIQGVGDKDIVREIRGNLPFMDFAPIIVCSAETGSNIDTIGAAISSVKEMIDAKVSTPLLNRIVQSALENFAPPTIKGRNLKVYYATKTLSLPAVFKFFVNSPDLCSRNYKAYLENFLRDKLGYVGLPVRVEMRGKNASPRTH